MARTGERRWFKGGSTMFLFRDVLGTEAYEGDVPRLALTVYLRVGGNALKAVHIRKGEVNRFFKEWQAYLDGGGLSGP